MTSPRDSSDAGSPPLIHVYLHDTDLLDRRRRAALRSSSVCSHDVRGRSTSTRWLRSSMTTTPCSRGTTWRGSKIGVSKAAPPAERPRPAPPQPMTGRDVRASRLYVLSRGPILTLVRRVLSVSALVILDVAGLALGFTRPRVPPAHRGRRGRSLEPALAGRPGGVAEVRGADHGARLRTGRALQAARRAGRGRTDPCLSHRGRAHRARSGSVPATTSRPRVSSRPVVVSAVTIGLFRAAYDSASLEVMRAVGIRRRVVLVGEGESLAACGSPSPRLAAASRTSSSGQSHRTGAGHAPPRLACRAPARARAGTTRRGDPRRGRLRRTHGPRGRRAGAPSGDQGAPRARHDGATRPARRVRPGSGSAALRASAACADRLGLGGRRDSICSSARSC